MTLRDSEDIWTKPIAKQCRHNAVVNKHLWHPQNRVSLHSCIAYVICDLVLAIQGGKPESQRKTCQSTNSRLRNSTHKHTAHRNRNPGSQQWEVQNMAARCSGHSCFSHLWPGFESCGWSMRLNSKGFQQYSLVSLPHWKANYTLLYQATYGAYAPG